MGREPKYQRIVSTLGGGWAQAIEAAGLDPVKPKIQARSYPSCTRDEAIAALRDAHAELGHSPATTWWLKTSRAPRYTAIVAVLGGSWKNALEVAGLPPVTPARGRTARHFEPEEVLVALGGVKAG